MQETNSGELLKIKNQLAEQDLRIIAQEHRIAAIVANIFKYAIDQPNSSKLKSASKSLLSYILRRQTSVLVISLGAGLISLTSLVVAYQTMRLLSEQNLKIGRQNELFIEQNQLVEADRRSSLVFLFNNVMDAIDNELKNPPDSVLKITEISTLDTDKEFEDGEYYELPGYDAVFSSSVGKLSRSLTARIISLSRRLKPYKHFNYQDSTMSTLTSPERGQLLINLYLSGLDSVTLRVISRLGDFSYADLSYIKLNDQKSFFYLEEANLSYANLTGAHMHNVTLNGVNLKYSKLRHATLHNQISFAHSEFNESDLEGISVENGEIEYTSFDNSNLKQSTWKALHTSYGEFNGSDLTGATISESNLVLSGLEYSILIRTRFEKDTLGYCFFTGSNLQMAFFQECLISECFFENSNLSRVDFSSSRIENSNFDNADLRGSKLNGANLKSILNSKNAKLDKATILVESSTDSVIMSKATFIKYLVDTYASEEGQILRSIQSIDSIYNIKFVKSYVKRNKALYQLILKQTNLESKP